MSGSDGGNGSADVDTDRFVSEDSIRWGEVAETTFGVYLRLLAKVVVGVVLLGGSLIIGFFDWVSAGYASLISLPFVQGSGVIALSSIETARWVATLGAFAWPVAVIIIALMVLIVFWGVGRFG